MNNNLKPKVKEVLEINKQLKELKNKQQELYNELSFLPYKVIEVQTTNNIILRDINDNTFLRTGIRKVKDNPFHNQINHKDYGILTIVGTMYQEGKQ